MNRLAILHEQEEVYQNTGRVIAVDRREFIIGNDAEVYRLRRAVSCLIEPEVSDRVLFCVTCAGTGYILAVLERTAGHAATIAADGDLNLRLDHGRFSLTAHEGVAIASSRKLSLVSPEFELKAVTGEVTIQQVSFVGSLFQASIDRIKLVAASFDSMLDRLHQRVKRSYRFVEETEQLRAQSIDHRAEHLLNLQGGNAVVNARELVKLNGEQIHIG